MRKDDAPPPGWYPDPVGGSRLRWWDGLDWTDHRQAPPHKGPAEVARPAPSDVDPGTGSAPPLARARTAGVQTRDETAAIMAEVRRVARDEISRATDRLSDSARDATRRLEPLIGQYGDRVMRWIRNIGIIAVLLFVLWMVLQTVGQASLMDWIGDRIDNLFGTGRAVIAGRRGG